MGLRFALLAACVSSLLVTHGVSMGAAVADVRLYPYASGLTQPVGFVQDPTNPAVQFVVEQLGRIRVLVAGQVQPVDLLDLSAAIATGGERGLLGLAFPPDAASTRNS